jgi:hypothetical protein
LYGLYGNRYQIPLKTLLRAATAVKKGCMEIVKECISSLNKDSSFVIEFENETWMRIYFENGKFKWYNSTNPLQTIIFQNQTECFRVLELSIKPNKIAEIVSNDIEGNKFKYQKKQGLEILYDAIKMLN